MMQHLMIADRQTSFVLSWVMMLDLKAPRKNHELGFNVRSCAPWRQCTEAALCEPVLVCQQGATHGWKCIKLSREESLDQSEAECCLFVCFFGLGFLHIIYYLMSA